MNLNVDLEPVPRMSPLVELTASLVLSAALPSTEEVRRSRPSNVRSSQNWLCWDRFALCFALSRMRLVRIYRLFALPPAPASEVALSLF